LISIPLVMQLVAESGGLALEMRFRHFLAGYRAASFPRLGATYRASDVKSFHGFLLRLKSVALMRARSLSFSPTASLRLAVARRKSQGKFGLATPF
jgi:hypothetical protein